MFNIWQDAGIRTRVAAAAPSCATTELPFGLCLVFCWPIYDILVYTIHAPL